MGTVGGRHWGGSKWPIQSKGFRSLCRGGTWWVITIKLSADWFLYVKAGSMWPTPPPLSQTLVCQPQVSAASAISASSAWPTPGSTRRGNLLPGTLGVQIRCWTFLLTHSRWLACMFGHFCVCANPSHALKHFSGAWVRMTSSQWNCIYFCKVPQATTNQETPENHFSIWDFSNS